LCIESIENVSLSIYCSQTNEVLSKEPPKDGSTQSAIDCPFHFSIQTLYIHFVDLCVSKRETS